MKLDLRARYNILKLMHQKVYCSLDSNELHVPVRLTRMAAAPVLTLCQLLTGKYRNSFHCMGHFLWNSLPVGLRSISDTQ